MAKTLPPKRPVGRPRKTSSSDVEYIGPRRGRYAVPPGNVVEGAAEVVEWAARNRARFIRVVYGNDKRRGRLEMLRQAFENLSETANSNHYQFSDGQATALIDVVEGYFQKFRKVFEAGPKRR